MEISSRHRQDEKLKIASTPETGYFFTARITWSLVMDWFYNTSELERIKNITLFLPEDG